MNCDQSTLYNEDQAEGSAARIALTAMTVIFGKEVSSGRTYGKGRSISANTRSQSNGHGPL